MSRDLSFPDFNSSKCGVRLNQNRQSSTIHACHLDEDSCKLGGYCILLAAVIRKSTPSSSSRKSIIRNIGDHCPRPIDVRGWYREFPLSLHFVPHFNHPPLPPLNAHLNVLPLTLTRFALFSRFEARDPPAFYRLTRYRCGMFTFAQSRACPHDIS